MLTSSENGTILARHSLHNHQLMKKIIGLICGLLCISAIASAQHVSAGVRIENGPGYYVDSYGPHCLEHSTSLHTWGPILYGRDYIKAENQLAWGKTLGILGIGVAISSVFCFNELEAGFTVLGSGAVLAGVGIPLWVSGQKKINVMQDDFSKRARDYMGISMNLSVGPTRNGVGLALNF